MQQVSTIGDMKTLAACINKLVQQGYTEDFKVAENGRLLSLQHEKMYEPQETEVVDFYRFEGASDPADNSILYVIETHDGIKGTLTDAYGSYSDPSVTKFIEEVQNFTKKPATDGNSKN